MSSPHLGAMGSEGRCVDPCCWCNNPWVKDPNKYGETVHSVPLRPKCECHDCTQARAGNPPYWQGAHTPREQWEAGYRMGIKQERERCAKVARGLMTNGGATPSSIERAKGWDDACERIEIGIRNGWKS